MVKVTATLPRSLSPRDAAGDSRRVTLKDVARRAGVHFTTVSLALRGHPGLPDGTRSRIVAIADELGYRRDPVLMALTSRRVNVHLPHKVSRMAFLTDQRDQASFNRTPHMRYFLEGAVRQAEMMGYSCDLIFIRGPGFSASDLEDRLRAKEYDGVIIGAFHLPDDRLTLDWSRYAIVKIDTRFMQPNSAFVANDQMGAVRLAWQRLRRLGYRRIGMAIGIYDEIATNNLYSAGSLIEQAGLPEGERIPPLYFDYADQVEDAVPKLREWARQHRPQVVICNWSHIVPMAVATGLRVPEELACVCLCLNDPDPRVAGVIQNHRAVGRRAAEKLALAAKAGERGIPAQPSAIYIAGQWQDGASAPPLA